MKGRTFLAFFFSHSFIRRYRLSPWCRLRLYVILKIQHVNRPPHTKLWRNQNEVKRSGFNVTSFCRLISIKSIEPVTTTALECEFVERDFQFIFWHNFLHSHRMSALFILIFVCHLANHLNECRHTANALNINPIQSNFNKFSLPQRRRASDSTSTEEQDENKGRKYVLLQYFNSVSNIRVHGERTMEKWVCALCIIRWRNQRNIYAAHIITIIIRYFSSNLNRQGNSIIIAFRRLHTFAPIRIQCSSEAYLERTAKNKAKTWWWAPTIIRTHRVCRCERRLAHGSASAPNDDEKLYHSRVHIAERNIMIKWKLFIFPSVSHWLWFLSFSFCAAAPLFWWLVADRKHNTTPLMHLHRS